jgi:transaldolase
MKLFIDSADPKEIRDCVEQGIIDGVTTNPSLLSKVAIASGREARAVLREICDLVRGPVSAEVTAEDPDGMLRQGRELAALAANVVVKLPLTTEGLKVVRILAGEHIKTNVTLCFSAVQALLAAKAGASYISPFIGRLDDIAADGTELVRQITAIYRTYDYRTEVLVASVRSPNQIVDSAMTGAHIATVPYAVLQQLVKHPLTDIGLHKFAADWAKLPK